MFIDNEARLGESILFLTAAREALSGIVEASSVKDKKELSSFLRNEATDFQVLTLLIDGELPEKRFDPVGEVLLFSRLKETVLYNYESLSKSIGNDACQSFIHEVGSIHPYQSAKPLLEYAMMLNEFDPGAGAPPRIAQLDKAAKKIADETGKAAGDIKKWLIAKSPAIKSELEASGEAGKNMVKQAANFYKEKGAEFGKEVGKGLKALGAGFKGAAKDVKSAIAAKDLQIKRAAQPQAMRKAGEKVAQAQQAGRDTALKGDIAAAGMAKTGGRTPAEIEKLKAGEKIAKAQTKTFDPSLKKDIAASQETWLSQMRTQVTSAKNAAVRFAQTPAGQAVGAAAAAALIIYASYKLYKNFFSKAARQCKGAPNKKVCMANAKVNAYQAQIKDLQSAQAGCAKTKQPAKCKAALSTKIAKLNTKIAKTKQKAA